MPPSTRIPPLLQPYVQLPHDESLLLLTSTLGASANWLLIRFLCNELSSNTQDGGEEGHNVILVSWMREYEFWKQEARKSAGLDMERLKKEGRFAFVDGLGAGADATGDESRSNAQIQPHVAVSNGPQAQRGPQVLPARGPPGRIIPARGPPVPASAATPTPSTAPNNEPTTDNPLLSLSTPPQPLEITHHNLVIKCAHMSRRILGVRVLDTGVARDVSGVVRVTEQRSHFIGARPGKKDGGDDGNGGEFLYQA
ncbi:hypothetical protein TUN205_06716 [Pyrenophora tritici-repentis]|nr:hypothetical protein TUN205_06716 [Pyrenophora tritici-repentis]